MWNRVVSDLPDTASSGSHLGDLIPPEPGLIRAVCWVTFHSEYLMCLQGSGQSIWNVCNCLCVQPAASCVHVGNRFLLGGCCSMIKPGHMLGTGSATEILCPAWPITTHSKPLQSGSAFLSGFISLYVPLCISSQIPMSSYMSCAFLPLCSCLSCSFYCIAPPSLPIPTHSLLHPKNYCSLKTNCTSHSLI